MALNIPLTLTSKKDVLRLRHEAEKLADAFLQSRVAKSKSDVMRNVPEPSADLSEFLELNNLKLDEDEAKKLVITLNEVYEKAPQIRMSFASEPDEESMKKITRWFRENAHPLVFVQVGIQPAIAAGCILRTSRHRYDFSLRTVLMKSVPKLQEAILNAGR